MSLENPNIASLGLVTDRQLIDVAKVSTLAVAINAGTATDAELAEWNSLQLKGAYNCTDLNRVQSAVSALYEWFSNAGYKVNGYAAVEHVWSESDRPTPTDMEQYLANVEALRNMITAMSTTPSTPSTMENLTYVEANAIEQILLDIDYLIRCMADSWFYSGDLYSGEG